MTGVQVYRALGAMFLTRPWLQGRMPGEFALPAGDRRCIVGDFGTDACAWLAAIRSPAAPAATLLFDVFEIAMLGVAVGTGT